MPTRTRGWIVQTSYHADRFDYERHLLSTCPARKGIVLPCSMSPHDEPHFHNYQLVAEVHPVLFGSMHWSKSLLTRKCLRLPVTRDYILGQFFIFIFILFWEEEGQATDPRAVRPVRFPHVLVLVTAIHPSIHPSRFGAQFKLAVLASSPRLGG